MDYQIFIRPDCFRCVIVEQKSRLIAMASPSCNVVIKKQQQDG